MTLDIHIGEYGSKDYMNEQIGSYGGYGRWRRSIAKASGFDLNKMTGYGGDTPWHNEPFQLILYHSYCDGQYSVNQLHLLLEEVKEIKKLEIDYNDQSNKFIRLITHAINIKKPLEFW